MTKKSSGKEEQRTRPSVETKAKRDGGWVGSGAVQDVVGRGRGMSRVEGGWGGKTGIDLEGVGVV